MKKWLFLIGCAIGCCNHKVVETGKKNLVEYSQNSTESTRIPKDRLIPQRRKLDQIPYGEATYLDEVCLTIDLNGDAWIWVGDIESPKAPYYMKVTREKDGWVVVTSKKSEYKWQIGTKEKFPTLIYEPVKKIIWE